MPASAGLNRRIRLTSSLIPRGCALKVSISGARLWRFKYSLHERERLLALGQYSDVSLSHAREKRDAARRLVADGIDPAVRRLVEKNAKADAFAVIAAEWLELQRKRFAPATMEKAEWTFRDLINPYIGNPLPRSCRLSCSTSFDVWRCAGSTKRRIERSSVAGRCSVTPSRPVVRRAILRRTFAARWLRLSRRIMRLSQTPRRVGELLRALHADVGLPIG